MPVQLPGIKAAGTIGLSRFVRYSAVNAVVAAGLGDVPFGVSQRGTQDTPITGASSNAATSGNVLQVFGNGEICHVEAGEAISAGAFLKPGAAGVALNCVGSEEYYAMAIEPAAASGVDFKVLLIRGRTSPSTITVAAAGTNAATATLLTANTSHEVTGATGSNGVILPDAPIGSTVTVYPSAATNALLVFPPTGGNINNGTTDASFSHAARTPRTYRRISATVWSA